MDIGGGSSFRGGEVSTTTPPVCEDNQSESRSGTGSRSRWRSGVSPPGEFDPLTVPLPVENDSNNNSSSSSEEENKDPNDDGDGDATLALKVNQEDKIRCVTPYFHRTRYGRGTAASVPCVNPHRARNGSARCLESTAVFTRNREIPR